MKRFRYLKKQTRSIPVEWEWLNFIGSNIDRIIDVGGNVGSYSERIRNFIGNQQIPASIFEPNRSVFVDEYLTPIDEIFYAAVGCHNLESVELNLAGNNGNSSSVLPMLELHRKNAPLANYTGEVLIVPQVTLDVTLESSRFSSALLKIDTQGLELEVLKGGVRTLERVYAICIEVSFRELYEGAPLFDRVFIYLKENGFDFFGMDPIFKDIEDNSWLQSDAFFIRRKVSDVMNRGSNCGY
jgi:hypothetical protein